MSRRERETDLDTPIKGDETCFLHDTRGWLQRRRDRKCAERGHVFVDPPYRRRRRPTVGTFVFVGDWCARCRRVISPRVPDDFDPVAHMEGWPGLPPARNGHVPIATGPHPVKPPVKPADAHESATPPQSGRQCCCRCHDGQA